MTVISQLVNEMKMLKEDVGSQRLGSGAEATIERLVDIVDRLTRLVALHEKTINQLSGLGNWGPGR
jgi:hypothetical protein